MSTEGMDRRHVRMRVGLSAGAMSRLVRRTRPVIDAYENGDVEDPHLDRVYLALETVLTEANK